MTALSVHEIRSAPALAALEPEWWELWRGCCAATPFQSPAWLLSWWDAFAPGDLFALAVRRGERLVGLAPFYVEIGPLGRRVLPLGISVSDYLDVLAEDGCADGVCGALARHMAGCALPWDTWELGELAPSAIALRLPPSNGCTDSSQPDSACPVLELPPSAKELDGAIPSRKRRDLRAARHRAARRGAVEITLATLFDGADTLAALATLHRARWQSQGEPGVLADPRVHRLHAGALSTLMRLALVRLYTLRIAGQIAGVYYGFLHGQRGYGYLTGFDPAFAFESPGTILIGHAIKQAVREGAREFHFLRGREKYKYQWGARDRWNRRRVFQRTAAHARAS
jgi:CelD/BcsL family acetyltransferase involved in cellulose biosynthesis